MSAPVAQSVAIGCPPKRRSIQPIGAVGSCPSTNSTWGRSQREKQHQENSNSSNSFECSTTFATRHQGKISTLNQTQTYSGRNRMPPGSPGSMNECPQGGGGCTFGGGGVPGSMNECPRVVVVGSSRVGSDEQMHSRRRSRFKMSDRRTGVSQSTISESSSEKRWHGNAQNNLFHSSPAVRSRAQTSAGSPIGNRQEKPPRKPNVYRNQNSTGKDDHNEQGARILASVSGKTHPNSVFGSTLAHEPSRRQPRLCILDKSGQGPGSPQSGKGVH